jgi:lysozyme
MPSRKQSVRLRKIVFTVLALVVVALGIWMTFQWFEYRKVKFTRYPEFGIAIPGNYEIHGIDVSRYQQLIAWESVAAMNVQGIRMRFAFIKATEGVTNTDPQFGRNWRRSRANGLARGAYHFFIASKDGRLQAEHFIRRVDLEKGDLPPVLDVEQLNGVSPAVLRREAREWLSIVEEHYGVRPIIYTNVDFYKSNLGKEFDDYPLWVAHYYEPRQPRIRRDWVFWQHSDEGRVNGIRARVDFNVFHGDSLAFSALLLK